MKKGISVWAFPEEFTPERCFIEAKRAGFDGVELAMGSSGITEDSTEKEIKAIRTLAEKHGIELYSVAYALYIANSLTSNDPAQRARAERIVKRQLDIAAWLGCDTVLVVPGVVSSPLDTSIETGPYDAAYDRALDWMRRLAPYAEERGVVIAIENVWNRFLLSPLEMRGIIDAVGSEWVKAYFDVGNILLIGHPEQWIRILGKRIQKVHIKDFRVSVGNLDGFVDLLTGNVDFPEVMRALSEIGYDGWITAELGPNGHYPTTNLAAISAAMDAIMNR